ncbi:unnamed protein product [Triticum turgidum subsp. durum]|uniref:DUF4220 domain-containing protein n=1 Tax=Triticum turgidum subsp. durum TaxID=4567 RepID=A0A9R1B5C7_TRITD|nr:unnamed protein product [Triticum turgidum subsp. durum]
MRVLRDRQDCIRAAQSYRPTAQHSLDSSSLGKLWDEWQIQCLMLVSFGLQVFLFLAAGMRRRSTSCKLTSLLWLVYLSADSVAIFVLGHLALHTNGPQHQLLFFWAPFVLLHLGGQDTMTAFSMQDNDLWRRHLLGLVTQVAAAGYVVSRTSWPDRRLLYAMVLMFVCGCLKYAERTLCLYRGSPTRINQYSSDHLRYYAYNTELAVLSSHVHRDKLAQRFKDMVNPDSTRFGVSEYSLVSDTPTNDELISEIEEQYILSLLQGLKSNEDCYRVYNYVSAELVHNYERLYTKAPIRTLYIEFLSDKLSDGPDHENWSSFLCDIFVRSVGFLLCTLLLLFPLLSVSTALVLFKVVEKGQLHSRADVTVSYILLIGAIILEVASLFMSILPCVSSTDIFQCATNQWSEMLGQYNMTTSLTRHQDTTCIMSFVHQRIGKYLVDDSISHIPITQELKKFVLDKLLAFGTREQDWNFASTHGKLALGKWMDRHPQWRDRHTDSVSARLETPLNSVINDLDLPTSVLILHIATDVLYFQDNKSISSDRKTMRKMSTELSNYIMYLVFKCRVMLTPSTEILHDKAHTEMKFVLPKHLHLGEKEAIMEAFEANREGQGTPREQATQMQLLKNSLKAITSQLLPSAFDVAQELIDIHRAEGDCWDLVSAVWVEMLYYIAPRCGGAFHSRQLTTGGEFITHVFCLMQQLGPFLPPPSA